MGSARLRARRACCRWPHHWAGPHRARRSACARHPHDRAEAGAAGQRHQREYLRFTNGIANTGPGDWRMRPEVVAAGSGPVQNAIQEILDADGNVVDEKQVSQYEFDAEHGHWHIDRAALFQITTGSPTGPVLCGNSIKVTFCLIDWYKLDDNPPHTETSYFHCRAERQGIGHGWVDQYDQATEGQALDITGMPAGDYYLVSTSNPDGNNRRGGHDEQHCVGELPAAPPAWRQPQDRPDRSLALWQQGVVRPADQQPLIPYWRSVVKRLSSPSLCSIG